MKKQLTVVIIDYDMGNVKSIENAIHHISEYKVKISHDKDAILAADCLILPGVGTFADAMQKLENKNLIDILNHAVLELKKPTLGICLGMQLLFERSSEIKLTRGLGWIPGHVELMQVEQPLTVPHVGWNDLNVQKDSPFFSHLTFDKNFYFVHSFHAICDQKYKLATFNYGHEMTAAVQYENVVGMQFHPEKSQYVGLQTLANFFNWAETYQPTILSQIEKRQYA